MSKSTQSAVPFFRPAIGEEEIAEVVDSLRNGWLTTGKKSAAFEAAFSEYLGGGVEAVAVNSATAGLHLALEAIGVGPGDEVIVPDYTFTATAEVVRYLGADPVFVDVDYVTLNLTPALVEPAITRKTKAIMPVHFAGLPCDMTGLKALADAHGLKIVEDAAHTLPAIHAGAMIGQHGSAAAVFSFYANKTITTGEGGMLVTSDPKIAKRARIMRLHGFSRDAFDRFSSGNWRYDIVAPGYKYNMTDIAAGIGLHQLKKADQFREARKRVMDRYREGLRELPLVLPVDAVEGDSHSWHLFIVRVTEEARLTRDALFAHLAEQGITCSVHYTPLHKFTYWRDTYALKDEQFPQSERAGNAAMSLPMYVDMPDEQIDYVINVLSEALG